MGRSFAELMRQSDELDSKLESDVKTGDSVQKDNDERFWAPSKDAAGNGSALIRFLPAHPDEDEAYVRIWSHFFKGPTGQWYVENCLTTIGKDDPCCEYNNQLWATEIEANRDQASDQKRKLNYYANIYVINDPLKPENNGTVRIFKFGPAIFEFIKNKLVPEFEDQQKIPVFNLLKGANFRIRIRKDDSKGGRPQYDRSEWDSVSALLDGDKDKLEEIYNQLHTLQPFKSTSNFKAYEELKSRLNRTLGIGGVDHAPSAREKIAETPAPELLRETPPPTPRAETAPIEDDDDDLDYFSRLNRDDE